MTAFVFNGWIYYITSLHRDSLNVAVLGRLLGICHSLWCAAPS
jgi:hypothetical protein